MIYAQGARNPRAPLYGEANQSIDAYTKTGGATHHSLMNTFIRRKAVKTDNM